MWKCNIKWGDIEQWGDNEQSYPFHGNSLNSAYNIHITRCLCFRLITEGFCSPTSKFLKCPHDLWPSFFAWTTIFKWKNLMFKTKLCSKVIFSKCIQRYVETSAWFVDVTDCYCSGKKNLNKFFLTTKLPFVQSHSILMGQLWTTLVVYNVQWTGCFPIWKREAAVV